MDIEYHLIRSNRRSIGIEVDREGKVTVRAPYSCEKKRIDRFLLEKENWIRQKVKLQKENAMKRQEKREMPEAEKKYYRNLAREVLGARTGYYARKMGVTYGRISKKIFSERTAYFAKRMGVTYNRITIREQKTRWGSCSSVGNLNYNWKLVLMPPGVLDYVVVHELAHRREMNHSAAFWKVVATWMPDYKKYRKWLRDNGNQF